MAGDGDLTTVVVFAFGSWGDAAHAWQFAHHRSAASHSQLIILASVPLPPELPCPGRTRWVVVPAVPPTAADEVDSAGATGLDAVMEAAAAAACARVTAVAANCWSAACLSVAERLWPDAAWSILSPAPSPAALSSGESVHDEAEDVVAAAVARDVDLAEYCAYFDGVRPLMVHAFAGLFSEHHAAWRRGVGLRPFPLLPLPLPPVRYTIDPRLVAHEARSRWPREAHCVGWRANGAEAPSCASLRAWLSAVGAPRPVVLIAMGSMLQHRSDARLDVVAWGKEIHCTTRARVVVQCGGPRRRPDDRACGCGVADGTDGNVWLVPHWVDHAAMMPDCAVVVHHAGAGTAHAVAATRCRSVAVPVAYDQSAWAATLAEAGRGCVLDAGCAASDVATAVAEQLRLPPLTTSFIDPVDWTATVEHALFAP